MFAYCGNNPVGNSDISGQIPYAATESEVSLLGGYGRFDNYYIVTPTGDPVWMHTLAAGKHANNTFIDGVLLGDVGGFGVSSEEFSLFSIDITAIGYRMQSEYIDLSLLDFFSAEVGFNINFRDKKGEFGFMFSAYNPTMTFHLGSVDITVGAHVGAYGKKITADLASGISIEYANIVGYSLSISW